MKEYTTETQQMTSPGTFERTEIRGKREITLIIRSPLRAVVYWRVINPNTGKGWQRARDLQQFDGKLAALKALRAFEILKRTDKETPQMTAQDAIQQQAKVRVCMNGQTVRGRVSPRNHPNNPVLVINLPGGCGTVYDTQTVLDAINNGLTLEW